MSILASWASADRCTSKLTIIVDYQAISNSWTFVETDVGIICACTLPPPHALTQAVLVCHWTSLGQASSKLLLTKFATGLPVLRVPLTRQLRSLLGLRKVTTVNSESTPTYALGTIGNISSRGRHQDPELDGDSVEDLIVNSQGGIKVTSVFSAQVTVTDMEKSRQESPDPAQQYPSWKVGGH